MSPRGVYERTPATRAAMARAKLGTQCGADNPNYRHGATSSPTFVVLKNIIQRCTNPRNPSFRFYGGAGIGVAPRWCESDGRGFLNFVADVGERPSGSHQLHRIDNGRGYEPGNVEWITASEHRFIHAAEALGLGGADARRILKQAIRAAENTNTKETKSK